MARPMRGLWAAVIVIGGGLGLPAIASAHLGLVYPQSRLGPNVLKSPPCGTRGSSERANVTVLEAGSMLTIQWDEYIDHPSHYRVALDLDGGDDFVDPATMDELYSADNVLLDGIADGNGGIQSIDVQLPDVECDNCTLQVIQVMYDKAPYGDGNDLYYQCADIMLVRGGTPQPRIGDAGVMPVDSGGGARTPDQDAGVSPRVSPPPSGTSTGTPGATGEVGCSVAGRLRAAPDEGSALFFLLALAFGIRRLRRATG